MSSYFKENDFLEFIDYLVDCNLNDNQIQHIIDEFFDVDISDHISGIEFDDVQRYDYLLVRFFDYTGEDLIDMAIEEEDDEYLSYVISKYSECVPDVISKLNLEKLAENNSSVFETICSACEDDEKFLKDNCTLILDNVLQYVEISGSEHGYPNYAEYIKVYDTDQLDCCDYIDADDILMHSGCPLSEKSMLFLLRTYLNHNSSLEPLSHSNSYIYVNDNASYARWLLETGGDITFNLKSSVIQHYKKDIYRDLNIDIDEFIQNEDDSLDCNKEFKQYLADKLSDDELLDLVEAMYK